jgi:hypothetical protein
MMRPVRTFLFLAMLLPEIAFAKSCATMTQELTRLRQDYHKYATSPPADGAAITFDELTAILDKIVALKHDIERSPNCKIPPRRKFPEEKR